VHGGLLRAGRATVNAYVSANQVGFDVWSNALVRFDQAAGPLVANLAVIEDFLLLRRVWIGLRNLVLEPLIKRFVLPLADQLGVALRRRIALIQRVIHAAIYQRSLLLKLVQLLRLFGHLVPVLTHVPQPAMTAWSQSGIWRTACNSAPVGSLRVTTLHATQPRQAAAAPAFATAPSGTYAVIVAVFCGLLLISNIAATKTITVVDGLPQFLGGGIFTDGGAFLFPLTYIVGDILAEVYGLRQAKRAIWVGFALGALASLTFLAVGAAPPGPGYENQEAFLAVLGFVPRIVLASLSGYLAGQFLNAYVVVKIKERTKERHLWARLIGSTVVGEFADTMLFCFIAFVGVFPTWGSLISYTVAGYFYKVLVEVIMLPVTYAVIRAIKKREPGYAPAPHQGGTAVRQMRLVVAVDDYDAAVHFYRDELGLPLEETYDGDNGAKMMILGAGRATLELSNRPQIDLIDTVEVGRTGVSEKYRVALEFDDSAGVTERLTAAGAELIAPPTRTPWNSLNARLQGPAGVQLTIFTELGPQD
jgi:uncharacterized integral membrane protein (TIGR00697 family)